jgi:hypothetical protein
MGKKLSLKVRNEAFLPSTFYAKKERYKNLAIYRFHGKRFHFEKLTGAQISYKFNAI